MSSTARHASADTILAGWTFDSLAPAPGTPPVIAPNLGLYGPQSALFANGQAGSSLWASSASNPQLTSFGGTPVNDPRSAAIAGQALALANSTANGFSIVLQLPTTGYDALSLTYATQRTGTGFTTQQWAWSTNGSTFTDINPAISPGSTFAATGAVGPTLSNIPNLNDAAAVYLRLTVTGASATAGNNRLDNITVSSTSFTWFGGTDSNPTNAANWSPGGLNATYTAVPTSGANVVFQNNPTNIPNFTSPTTVGKVTFLPATLFMNVAGTANLTINGGVDNKASTQSSITAPVVLGASQTWNARNGVLNATNSLALGSGANNYTLTVDGAFNTFLSGTISNGGSGASDIVKTGAGVLTLNGSNSFTGGLRIDAGVVQIGNVGALNSTTPNAVSFGASSTGTLRLSGRSVTVSSLDTNASAGSTVVENASGTPATLTINKVSGAASYNGTIRDGSGGGALSLVKSGAGALTLAGAHTFSGGATISDGKFVYNGTHTGGGVWTVNANATLAGAGSTTATADVQLNGHLAPGGSVTSSVGTIAVGALTLETGSKFDVEFDAPTAGPVVNDRITVTTGAVDVSGATLSLSLVASGTNGYFVTGAGSTQNGFTYTILDKQSAGAVTGTFAGLAEGATIDAPTIGTKFRISYIGGTDNNDITLTTVPEPMSLAPVFLVLVSSMRRARRGACRRIY